MNGLTGITEIKTKNLCQSIRLLRSPEGVEIVMAGEMDVVFAGDRDAMYLKMVEKWCRCGTQSR